MKLASIFKLLEHVNDFFEQLDMVVILLFKIGKIFFRHVYIALNIPCKFGEDIFINGHNIKIYVKT